MDVYLIGELNHISLATLILKLKNGKHENDKRVSKITTNKITIKLKEKVKSNIDGEILEDDKFKIEVQDKKLEVFYDEKLIKFLKK